MGWSLDGKEHNCIHMQIHNYTYKYTCTYTITQCVIHTHMQTPMQIQALEIVCLSILFPCFYVLIVIVFVIGLLFFFLRQKEAKCSNFVASGSGFGVS